MKRGMKHNKLTLKLIFSLVVMIIAQGCISYKFNGASLDYNKYKTVSFDNFPIRAALVYPPLQQLFAQPLCLPQAFIDFPKGYILPTVLLPALPCHLLIIPAHVIETISYPPGQPRQQILICQSFLLDGIP